MIKLPPRKILIEALREAIKLEWEGTFAHEIDNLHVDELKAIQYTRITDELLKKAEKKKKQEFLKGYSRYNLRIGHETKWNEQASVVVDEKLIRMVEAIEVTTLDDEFVKIVANPLAADGVHDEASELGSITLTVH